ncbi:hypothetical protein [Anaerotruncus colihominis]|uniref:Uncharacterized protein n=1 Tax=Anaerotruncus colihominis TaxID=169435 RepID=A0A845SU06_9FIRM|nr:hypothetical protein [Anaerotruncus colihominis]NDO37754.1 hypothetical protein [Anaerotruncus colihominis]
MTNVMTNTEISLEKSYKDSFSLSCRDEEIFLELLNTLNMERQTKTIKIKQLVFKPLPTAIEASNIFDSDEDFLAVVNDSIENGTKLYLEIDGCPYMLRNTAMASIYERLRISGDALESIPAAILAQHLNNYAAYADNDGLLIFNNRKIEAILGRKYNLFPAETVMELAADYFAQGTPAKFVGGSYSHDHTLAVWNTGECRVEVPFDSATSDILYEQSVSLSTSDCGRKAITISPQMRQKGDRCGLAYCLPLKLEHDRNTNMEKLQSTMALIDKRFQDANDCIRNLLDTTLEHPANVLLSMYKWLKIPAKYGAVIYESRKVMWGNRSQTAYDVYASLSDVLSLVMGEEKSQKKLAEYREGFARALKFDFTGHDLPGQYSYKDKYIGKKGV